MNKSSIKKYSILSLVLLSASAITAAVLPSKTSNTRFDENNGQLTASAQSGGALGNFTCKPVVEGDANCVNTVSGAGAGFQSGDTATGKGGTRTDGTTA